MDGENTTSGTGNQQSLPDYTYVPGWTPHPISDPRGHSRVAPVETLDLETAFALGRRLFNHGYYWEAHEAWESAWHLVGRTGPAADFLKGLIKLAACGVKCLEGNRAGARRHAHRAGELFSHFPGVPGIESLRRLANQLSESPPLADETARERARQGGVLLLQKIDLHADMLDRCSIDFDP